MRYKEQRLIAVVGVKENRKRRRKEKNAALNHLR